MLGVKRVAKATDVELGVARSRPRYLEEAVCVVSRHEFYRVRSIVEGWSILKDALSSPDQQGTLLWADGVYCMTSTASSIDHVGAVRAYPDAVELLTKALDIAISNGDKSLAVKICATLTGRAISTHDYDKVTYWAQRAFEESQGCTDPLALAIAHGEYATTLQGQEKKDHFETSLQYYKESGNVMAIARGLVNISNSLRTEDEDVPERSSTLLKEAHRLVNSIGAVSAAAKADSFLALWLTVLGENDEAELRTRRSNVTFVSLGLDSGYIAWNAITLAELARQAGNHERSATLMGWALDILSDPTGSTWNAYERIIVAAVERDGKAALGDALYQEHVSRGATMSRNDAVVLSRQPTAAA